MREELRGVSSFVAWDVDRAQDPAEFQRLSAQDRV